MFEGLSVNNSNSLAPSLTFNNGTNLTPLFDAMSIQPSTTPNQPLNTDNDDGLIGLGHQGDMFNHLVRSSSMGSTTGSLLGSSDLAFVVLKQPSMNERELTAFGNMIGALPTTYVQQQPQQVMLTVT